MPSPDIHRNSKIREFFQEYLESLAGITHKTFPNLTANHISLVSFLGVAAVALATYVLEKKEGKLYWRDVSLLVTLYLLFSILDGFDGTLKREIKNRHPDMVFPDSKSFWNGQIVDYAGDRLAEMTLILLSIMRAELHKDELGFVISLITGVSNILPSYFRAEAERYPHNPEFTTKEGGLGTRQWRFIFAIVVLLPYIRHSSGVSLQAVVNAIQGISNMQTALIRRETAAAIRAAEATQPAEIEPTEEQELAVTRKQVAAILLGVFGIVGTASILVVARNKSR